MSATEQQPSVAASDGAERIASIDAIIDGLREELNACRATHKGYREAAVIRGGILVWKDQLERIAAYAALTPRPIGEGK